MQARILWRRRVLAVGTVVAFGLVAVACSGSNLFQLHPELAPIVSSLTSADSAVAGQQFEVQVTATSLNGVAKINVSLLGAAVKDTSVAISPPQTQANRALVFTMPDTLLDSSLTVQATAADSAGNTSVAKTLTVPAVGPGGATP